MASSLSSSLYLRARAWAGQLTTLAKGHAPAHIQPFISSHVEGDDGSSQYTIRITTQMVDGGHEKPNHEGQSMDARAQEYGSGWHARRGGLKDIIIRPKNAKALVFPWQVAENNPAFKHTSDGKVILMEVHHPGITAANEGQGYIAPAINQLRARGRAELDTDVRQAILDDLRRSFTSKNG
jgi:hypothetical protein